MFRSSQLPSWHFYGPRQDVQVAPGAEGWMERLFNALVSAVLFNFGHLANSNFRDRSRDFKTWVAWGLTKMRARKYVVLSGHLECSAFLAFLATNPKP